MKKQKEDSKWKDEGTKILKSKEERKISKEEKKQAELARKEENRALYEQEMESLKSSIRPSVISENKGATKGKITQAEIERERQKALMATLLKNVNKNSGNEENFEQEIEENINHILRQQEEEDKERYDQVINVNNIDEALDKMEISAADRHPEKRVKAVFPLLRVKGLSRLCR